MKKYVYTDENALRWLHYIRKIELDTAVKFFPTKKNIRILEIGGGEGYLAKCISDLGYDVTSIDMNPRLPQNFPVEKVDASKLNFQSQFFDLVFTSHVVPHIEDKENVFNEIKRVLKDDGIVIHVVPTPWWTFLTNFYHYCFIPKFLMNSITNYYKKSDKAESNLKENGENLSSKRKIKHLFLNPIGVYPSSWHEFYYSSKVSWIDLFKKHGFKIIEIKRCPQLSSGYGIFKMKFLKSRQFLAKNFFSSSYCFVLKK